MSGATNFIGAAFKKKPKNKQSEHELEDIALRQFRARVSSYRDSFTPYNQRAPGFDYVSWKPYGYWRQEDPKKTYLQQCKALTSWVKATSDAGIQGLEEKRWMGLVGQPEEMIKSQSQMASRAGSREDLIG